MLKILLSLILFAIIIFPSYAEPQIKDSDYLVQKFVSGISRGATSMAFEGNDILVLQKEDGKVRIAHNGTLEEKPALDENVTGRSPRMQVFRTTAITRSKNSGDSITHRRIACSSTRRWKRRFCP